MDKLFEPIHIGNVLLKNRIVMAPMGTVLANENGGVTAEMMEYYKKRAEGGCGLIVVENAAVDAVRNPCRLSIQNDHFIAGLNDLATTIRNSGAKVFIQLAHKGFGSAAPYRPDQSGGGIRDDINGLEKSDLKAIVGKFAKAAKRAKIAAFDGVEIHACHWYLICKFMSPYYNKRTDEYGGNLENRTRFAIEILEAIQSEAGNDFPVIFRINASDYMKDGLTVDDATWISKTLEKKGAAAIHLSGAQPPSVEYLNTPMGFHEACHLPTAISLKKSIKIPVILAGNIHRAELAEKIVNDGNADIISLGRPLIADPDFPQKVQNKNYNHIRPCISCNNCLARVHTGLRIACSVNPWLRKRSAHKSVVGGKKKILVIGGGLAGMHAASIIAKNKHECTLVEKTNRLGGMLNLADLSGGKPEIKRLLEYYRREISQSGAQIKLNQTADAEFISSFQPDIVVLATGSKPNRLLVSPDADTVFDFSDVLSENTTIGDKVIIIGGGQTGCECALKLSQDNKQIVIIEQLQEVAIDAEVVYRKMLLSKLEKNKIKIITQSKTKKVEKGKVIIEDKTGNTYSETYNTAIFAMGSRPELSLTPFLKKSGIKFYCIGDCSKVGKIFDAIHNANDLVDSLLTHDLFYREGEQ